MNLYDRVEPSSKVTLRNGDIATVIAKKDNRLTLTRGNGNYDVTAEGRSLNSSTCYDLDALAIHLPLTSGCTVKLRNGQIVHNLTRFLAGWSAQRSNMKWEADGVNLLSRLSDIVVIIPHFARGQIVLTPNNQYGYVLRSNEVETVVMLQSERFFATKDLAHASFSKLPVGTRVRLRDGSITAITHIYPYGVMRFANNRCVFTDTGLGHRSWYSENDIIEILPDAPARYWIVIGSAASRHPFRHNSQEEALKEAERLSKKHPNQVFTVFEATNTALTTTITTVKEL